MREEFAVYGLPSWALGGVGTLKVGLALFLIAGIWFPALVVSSAWAMAALMLGAIGMRVTVKNPPQKSLPAFSMLAASATVALL